VNWKCVLSKFFLVRFSTAAEDAELLQFVFWLRSRQYLQCDVLFAGDPAGTFVCDCCDWWMCGWADLAIRTELKELN
jgi:hypothetical protein